jgi:hypothetical protein
MTPTTALDIPCRYCHAPPGQPCHNQITTRPLENFRAHQCRITDAKTIIPLPTTTPDDAEDLF